MLTLVILVLRLLVHPWQTATLASIKADPIKMAPEKTGWDIKRCQNRVTQGCCSCQEDYQACQPCFLSANAKGSVVLPCTFNHTSKWRPTTDIRVSWRLEGFHSKIFVFNYTNNTTQYTHHNYSDRIALVGDLQKNNASIQIAALKESDSNKYFCRVHMKISTGKEEFWQTLEGTNLTVSGALPPPSTTLMASVTGAVLLLALVFIVGLLLFLIRTKGWHPKSALTRTALAREQQEEEEEVAHRRGINPTRLRESAAQPPACSSPAHTKSGLIYATLAFAEQDAKKKRPPEGPREASECGQTTYAALRP